MQIGAEYVSRRSFYSYSHNDMFENAPDRRRAALSDANYSQWAIFLCTLGRQSLLADCPLIVHVLALIIHFERLKFCTKNFSLLLVASACKALAKSSPRILVSDHRMCNCNCYQLVLIKRTCKFQLVFCSEANVI